MRRLRLFGPVVLTPLAVAAGAALGGWLWKRWGYSVDTLRRDVEHAPGPPIDTTKSTPVAPDVQTEDEGTGARFHRRYEVVVERSTLSPEALMDAVKADIQAFVPDELARFEKTSGAPERFAVGDEFHIHISSPWDGPVRVADVTATSFAFVTLEGHLEAGQIRFSAQPEAEIAGGLRFRIESWARSADALVDFSYDTIGLARAAQQGMWTFFCRRVAEQTGGEQVGDITVLTEREAEPGDGSEVG